MSHVAGPITLLHTELRINFSLSYCMVDAGINFHYLPEHDECPCDCPNARVLLPYMIPSGNNVSAVSDEAIVLQWNLY